jgi:hypothetical protein
MPAARLAGFGLVWIALIIFTVDGLAQRRRGKAGRRPTQRPPPPNRPPPYRHADADRRKLVRGRRRRAASVVRRAPTPAGTAARGEVRHAGHLELLARRRLQEPSWSPPCPARTPPAAPCTARLGVLGCRRNQVDLGAAGRADQLICASPAPLVGRRHRRPSDRHRAGREGRSGPSRTPRRCRRSAPGTAAASAEPSTRHGPACVPRAACDCAALTRSGMLLRRVRGGGRSEVEQLLEVDGVEPARAARAARRCRPPPRGRTSRSRDAVRTRRARRETGRRGRTRRRRARGRTSSRHPHLVQHHRSERNA